MVSNESLLNDILLHSGMVVVSFAVYIDKNFDDKLLDPSSTTYKETEEMVLEVVRVNGFYCIPVQKHISKFKKKLWVKISLSLSRRRMFMRTKN